MYVLLLLFILTFLSVVFIQMGKQTMGIPLHAWTHRSDSKLYRLQTAQSPIVRPYLHDDLGMDNYPLGTNAIVAVLSYTVRLVLFLQTVHHVHQSFRPGFHGTCCRFLVSTQRLLPVVSALLCPQFGTHSLLTFALLLHRTGEEKAWIYKWIYNPLTT